MKGRCTAQPGLAAAVFETGGYPQSFLGRLAKCPEFPLPLQSAVANTCSHVMAAGKAAVGVGGRLRPRPRAGLCLGHPGPCAVMGQGWAPGFSPGHLGKKKIITKGIHVRKKTISISKQVQPSFQKKMVNLQASTWGVTDAGGAGSFRGDACGWAWGAGDVGPALQSPSAPLGSLPGKHRLPACGFPAHCSLSCFPELHPPTL